MLLLAMKYWYAIVIAGLLALCGFQKIHIVELQKDQIKLQSDYNKLDAASQECSNKVTELENNSKTLLNNLTTAQTNASKMLSNSKSAIDSILKQKIPTDCAGAMKDLVGKVQHLDWNK